MSVGDYYQFDSQDVEKDALFHIPVSQDAPHAKMHEGDAYSASVVDTTLADTEFIDLCFKTPATKLMHMTFDYKSLTGLKLEIFEGATWDAQTGTAVPVFNMYRDSANTSGVLENRSTAAFLASSELMSNPTTPAGGTAILTDYLFGAANKLPEAGGSRVEQILKAGTLYRIRLTSTAANNSGQIRVSWYEHTNRSNTN